MEKTIKSYLQLSLKLFNSIAGLAGIAMIMYGLWLIRVWQSDMKGSSSDNQASFPWFIHAFIGLGISLCAVTCLGHFAAHTAYSHFLSCYICVMSLLLLVETLMMAHIFLSSEWEKEDLPEDPTGGFDDFKHYVESELNMGKWLSVLIVFAQGVSILLATVMKTLKTDLGMLYECEDESVPYLPPYTSVHQLPSIIGGTYFAFADYV
ncbi:putative tetraspanin/Peripherin [Heracleum sosnowskyi]|uniref:Tetraspanin/Peripherin n=1 Tax=Heracleum sosnowskyi TaxID=360622 RepID=A0AAD8MCL4_9APIA|nr:putative tetraspanin/Peripherin [Heracleum sosnowskyi]